MVAGHLEPREEPEHRDWILTPECVGFDLDVQLLPISVNSPRSTRVVARAAVFQPIAAVFYGLGEQVVQRPDHRQPFRIPPRGRPAVSAPAMAVSFSAGATVALRIGVFSPEPTSVMRVAASAVAPPRFARLGVIVIGGVSTSSGIAVSRIASLAVIIERSNRPLRHHGIARSVRRGSCLSPWGDVLGFLPRRGFLCPLRCILERRVCFFCSTDMAVAFLSQSAPGGFLSRGGQPYRRVREGHCLMGPPVAS